MYFTPPQTGNPSEETRELACMAFPVLFGAVWANTSMFVGWHVPNRALSAWEQPPGHVVRVFTGRARYADLLIHRDWPVWKVNAKACAFLRALDRYGADTRLPSVRHGDTVRARRKAAREAAEWLGTGLAWRME